MAKMRTIDQYAEELKQRDPDTALTKTAIRRLVLENKFPHIKVGGKYLVNIDAAEIFYQTGNYRSPIVSQNCVE